MACSTCDDYEFVPGTDGVLEDCPDCRALDARPLAWCPVHSVRLELDLSCRHCGAEAMRGITMIQARAAVAAAR